MATDYSLVTAGDTQYNPPPAVKETGVFEGWQDFLSGLSSAVKSTATTIAETRTAVDQIQHDTTTSASTPTPKKQTLSPGMALVIGVALAFVAKKVLKG